MSLEWDFKDALAENLHRVLTRERADELIRDRTYSVGMCAALLFDSAFRVKDENPSEFKRIRDHALEQLAECERLRKEDRSRRRGRIIKWDDVVRSLRV